MDANAIGKRFIAGSASGVSLVAVGYPWDTLKVKMQVDYKEKSSLYSTILSTFRTHGLRGFYFGVSLPLLTTGGINTLLWGLQFNLVELFPAEPNPVLTTMKAAFVSGILITTVVTPIELIKSKLQVGTGNIGPRHVFFSVWERHGWRGLYRGATAVALVRSSNWAYFGTYAAIQNQLNFPREVNALIAGGVAGIAFWMVAFPFDTIKCRMMIDNTGFRPTVRAIYFSGGWSAFFRGLSPCLIRAFPANAAAFGGFELTMKWL